MPDHYDVAVIGCGAGGYQAAMTAAQCGARVVLIERGPLGGGCLNRACVPKKALTHIARVCALVQGLLGRGLAGEIAPHVGSAIAWKDALVDDLQNGLPRRLRSLGIGLLLGEARLVSASQIRVWGPLGAQDIEARRIILATGAAPRALAACPVDSERIVYVDHLLDLLAREPRRVLCVGGGLAGVEAAFLLRQWGCEVTLVTQDARLIERPSISPRVSQFLARRLEESGVRVLTHEVVVGTTVDQAGVTAIFGAGGEDRFDAVLVAVGRVPGADLVGCNDVGIARDALGFVATRATLETNVPGIYAIGDMKGGPMTAAAAMHDGRIAAENAVLDCGRRRNYHQVPLVVDSILPVAAVGLSEELAEQAGFSPEVLYIPLSRSVKARALGDTQGFIEIVHDDETGQMLGGGVVGAGADEFIHFLLAACRSRRGLWSFTDLDYGHPSWSEEVGAVLTPYLGELTRSSQTLFRAGIYATAD